MTKKNLVLLLKIGITIGILCIIFSKIPIQEVWEAIKRAKFIYVLAGFLILVGVRYLMAFRIKILTDVHQMKISIQQFFEISFIAVYYGFFLPGTLAGGAIRWYKISKAGNRPAETLTAIVYDRLINSLWLVTIGIVFWIFERQADASQGLGLILLTILVFLVGGYVLAFNGKVAALLIRLNDAITLIPAFVRDKINKVLASSMEYREIAERKHVEIFIASIICEFFGVIALYLFSLALELPLTFVQIGWIRSIVIILAMLPVSFSGIGIREGGLIFLLNAYGIAPANAVALSFLMLFSRIGMALLGGLFELKSFILTSHRSKEAEKGNSINV